MQAAGASRGSDGRSNGGGSLANGPTEVVGEVRIGDVRICQLSVIVDHWLPVDLLTRSHARSILPFATLTSARGVRKVSSDPPARHSEKDERHKTDGERPTDPRGERSTEGLGEGDRTSTEPCPDRDAEHIHQQDGRQLARFLTHAGSPHRGERDGGDVIPMPTPTVSQPTKATANGTFGQSARTAAPPTMTSNVPASASRGKEYPTGAAGLPKAARRPSDGRPGDGQARLSEREAAHIGEHEGEERVERENPTHRRNADMPAARTPLAARSVPRGRSCGAPATPLNRDTGEEDPEGPPSDDRERCERDTSPNHQLERPSNGQWDRSDPAAARTREWCDQEPAERHDGDRREEGPAPPDGRRHEGAERRSDQTGGPTSWRATRGRADGCRPDTTSPLSRVTSHTARPRRHRPGTDPPAVSASPAPYPRLATLTRRDRATAGALVALRRGRARGPRSG